MPRCYFAAFEPIWGKKRDEKEKKMRKKKRCEREKDAKEKKGGMMTFLFFLFHESRRMQKVGSRDWHT